MHTLRSVLGSALAAVGVAVFASPVAADDMQPGSAAHASMLTVGSGAEIKWMAGPPGLPKGAEMAVLAGNPGKPGLFIVRARTPDGWIVPPHWHSQAENVTVLQGKIHLGSGSQLDKSKTQPVSAGGFFSMPAKMQHFVLTEGQTIIEISGEGPFDIVYVNPEDAKQAMK